MHLIDRRKKHPNRRKPITVKGVLINVIQLLILLLAAVFILSPLLLKCKCFELRIHNFFSALNTPDYVSSYIESIGALLGTFLAITGTIWTQRIIDRQNAAQQLKEGALIIYYDFKFAVDDICKFLHSYLNSSKKGKEKGKTTLRIYIDDQWIRTVAKLAPSFSGDEIQAIYDLYGHLSTIKDTFNGSLEIKNITETDAYSLMKDKICKVTKHSGGHEYDVVIRDSVNSLIQKLHQASGISEKK